MIVMREKLRGIANRRINPDGMAYRLIFAAARITARLGLLKANTRIELMHCEAGDLVLTPLAGSSSVRRQMRGRLGMVPREGKPLFLLTRDDGLRAQSFFNKKVANADTVGKALLLAQCRPLRPQSSIEDFLRWLENQDPNSPIDKHLWPLPRILAHLGRAGEEAEQLDIATDPARIEALIGQPLAQRVNSSADVASYRAPERFDEGQRVRAAAAMARLS